MSSLHGEGQDAIPTDPAPILAPADSVSTSTPFIPIASITAKANTVTAVDSTPQPSDAMDSFNIAEASGSSSAAPAAPPPSASTPTPTAIPSDERPLPPTPTAPVTPAKLLSLPLRPAPESSSAGEGSSSSSTSAPAAPISESTTPSQPTATPSQVDAPAPASTSAPEPASEPAPTLVALRSVIDRTPTPAPPTVNLAGRALPLPPPPPSNPDATSTVLRETVPPPPAPQPARRVSIALPQSQSQQNQAPLPPTPQPSSSRRLSQVEYIVPPWQPDRDVMYCPICFVYFGLFNRKHHCRKCGRVVCNSCSPHRIVIPHAFIVQPPEVLAAREREQAAAGASSSATPATATRPATAFPVASSLQADGVPVGGERVRLCNPCVPDPNTSPPAAPGGPGSGPRSAAHSRSRSGSSISGAYNYSSRRQGIEFSGGSSGPGVSGDRRYTISNGPSTGSMPSSSGRNQYYGSLPQHHSRSHRDEAGPSSRRQQQPRQQIPEEDECPVCHLELPKRTLDNWELLREHHIEECITLHSQYMMGNNSGAGRNRATSTATASSGRSGASAQPTPARTNRHGNSVSGSDGTSSSVDSADSSGSGSGPGSAAFSPSSPRVMAVHRHTGVFPYKATAKDCAADAECTICLEEFEVGDGMARLECFCRFHEQCIRAWFVRHPGRCPVHQHGMAD